MKTMIGTLAVAGLILLGSTSTNFAGSHRDNGSPASSADDGRGNGLTPADGGDTRSGLTPGGDGRGNGLSADGGDGRSG